MKAKIQDHKVTAEKVRDIINVLVPQDEPAKEPVETSSGAAATGKEQSPYRPRIQFTVADCEDTITIMYSDIHFVSVESSRIRLPYRGSLPDSLLESVYYSALEACFNYSEFLVLLRQDKWRFKDVIANIDVYICPMPSRLNPLIGIKVIATTTNDKCYIKDYFANADPQHTANLLTRFFNRKNTGLKPDICACFEQQHIEYKRKHSK